MFREYLVLEIQISALEAEQFLLSAKGPGGDARVVFTLPLADATYQALAARLDRLDVDETALEQLGQALFHTLFQGSVKDLYARTQGKLSADQGLRIILNISPTAAEVAALPWEFLYDPDHGPLALLDSPIVRFLPQPSAIPTLATALPLRVLLT
ncbi:MAG: CHAT domain-containing protein, partial [Roseiflexaceae bacterium]